MEEAGKYAGLILSCITLAGLVYGWFTAGGTKALAELATFKKEANEKFDKIKTDTDAKVDEQEKQLRTFGDAMVARFNLQETTLAGIQETLKHFPDRDQSHRLELAIEKLTGRMETMDQRMTGRIETLDERLKPVSAISDRLQEFLLEQAKR